MQNPGKPFLQINPQKVFKVDFTCDNIVEFFLKDELLTLLWIENRFCCNIGKKERRGWKALETWLLDIFKSLASLVESQIVFTRD